MSSSRAMGRDPGPLEVQFTLGPMKLDGNDRHLIRPEGKYHLLSEVYSQKNATQPLPAAQVFDGQTKWPFRVAGLPLAPDAGDGVMRCDESIALRLSLYEEGQLSNADVKFDDVQIGMYVTMTPSGCTPGQDRYVGKVKNKRQDTVTIQWNEWEWGGPPPSKGVPKERDERREWWTKEQGGPTTATGIVSQKACAQSQRIRLGDKELEKEILARSLKFRWRAASGQAEPDLTALVRVRLCVTRTGRDKPKRSGSSKSRRQKPAPLMQPPPEQAYAAQHEPADVGSVMSYSGPFAASGALSGVGSYVDGGTQRGVVAPVQLGASCDEIMQQMQGHAWTPSAIFSEAEQQGMSRGGGPARQVAFLQQRLTDLKEAQKVIERELAEQASQEETLVHDVVSTQTMYKASRDTLRLREYEVNHVTQLLRQERSEQDTVGVRALRDDISAVDGRSGVSQRSSRRRAPSAGRRPAGDDGGACEAPGCSVA